MDFRWREGRCWEDYNILLRGGAGMIRLPSMFCFRGETWLDWFLLQSAVLRAFDFTYSYGHY